MTQHAFLSQEVTHVICLLACCTLSYVSVLLLVTCIVTVIVSYGIGLALILPQCIPVLCCF